MNVGRLDQIIRIVIGVFFILLAYFEIIGAWGYVGAIPLFTGLVRWCPLYSILGFQTCPVHAHIDYKK